MYNDAVQFRTFFIPTHQALFMWRHERFADAYRWFYFRKISKPDICDSKTTDVRPQIWKRSMASHIPLHYDKKPQ